MKVKAFILFSVFTLSSVSSFLVSAQQVTIEITGTVTSVDSALVTEFAVGEAVVFTAEVDASAGFDVFSGSTVIDGTRFIYSSSNPAMFTVGGDYTGISNSGQLTFIGKRCHITV